MIPGSVLLQPQRLRRASTRDASAALMDDLVRLAFCLAKDVADDAPALLRIEQSVEAAVQAMLTAKIAGIQAAAQRFAGLFDTLRQRVEALIAEGFDDAGDAMRLVTDLLISLAGAAEGLSPDVLRQRVNEVFAVVADDLGITPAFIEEFAWTLFDGAILALSETPDDASNDESPAQRANRREIARLLGRVKRGLRSVFKFPQLNADLAADALLTLFKNLGLDQVAGRVACSGKGLAACFDAGTSLLDLIHYSASPTFGEGSLGAAAAPSPRETYCWYATWLLEYQNVNGDLGVLPDGMTSELLVDGPVSGALLAAFRPLSVVLARSAVVKVVTDGKEWKVFDRKKYVVKRAGGGDLTVHYAIGEGSETSAGGVVCNVTGELAPELDQKKVSGGMLVAFDLGGVPLTPNAKVTVRTPGTEWLVDDGELEYTIEKEEGKLEVRMGGAGGWIQSQLGWPDGDKVWIDKDASRVMLGQRILHLDKQVKWQDAPIFKDGTTRYTFKRAQPDLLEHFAFHSAWSRDMLNTLLHLISIEKGDIASNTVNASWNLYEMIMKLALRRPSADVIGYWPNWSIPLAGTILASLEGMQTQASPWNRFVFWSVILLSTDLGERALYSYWLSLLRNLFLSFVTLLNQDTSDAAVRVLNQFHAEPWISGVVDLYLLVLAAAIPKDMYTYPFDDAGLTGGFWIVGGLGAWLLSDIVARAAAEALHGPFNAGYYLKAGVKGFLVALGRFWPTLYLVKEGATADGTYNPDGPSFAGYPKGGASSPYNMPYSAGTDVLWVQCNQGMFSHHRSSGETYAFDLAMDQGDPVLAMRPGTVVDYFDWVPDDTYPDNPVAAGGTTVPGQRQTSRVNFITIRHDRDESGNLLADSINDDYDRDQGGMLTVTYASYLHGRNGSVRSVFAARGIAATAIIGQPVPRGRRIMLAGDTGKSLHNHLHIHVQPGPPPGQFSTDPVPAPPNPDLRRGKPDRSIPFTFREVDDVPTKLNTYTSQNQET